MSDNARASMLANAWDVIAFRFVAITIAFLVGLPVGVEGFAGTNTRAVNLVDVFLSSFTVPLCKTYTGCMGETSSRATSACWTRASPKSWSL